NGRKRHIFCFLRSVTFTGIVIRAKAGVFFVREASRSREEHADAANYVPVFEDRDSAWKGTDAAGLGSRENPAHKSIRFRSLQSCSVRDEGVGHIEPIGHEIGH